MTASKRRSPVRRRAGATSRRSRSSKSRGRGRARGIAGAARSRRRAPPTWALVGASLLLLVVGFVLGRFSRPQGLTEATATAAAEAAPTGSAGRDAPRPAEAGDAGSLLASEPAARGLVALVIDDLGRSVEVLDRLEALGVELSYSVLPFESKTSEVASILGSRQREVLLHLPMEAGSEADPGPGALYSYMDASELVQSTDRALAAVPGAVGVNNHMGSLLSSRRRSMRPVLKLLRERDLFFLDSRTSPRSVAFREALELGLRAAKRDVFLDSEPEAEKIRQQFSRLLERARTAGAAVAIGHPHDATLAVLAEEIPKALDAGYRFVLLSELLAQEQSSGVRRSSG